MSRRKNNSPLSILFFTLFILCALIDFISSLSPMIIILALLVISTLLTLFVIYRRHIKLERFYAFNDLKHIDAMTGHQFEFYIGDLLTVLGFETKVTKGSGDDGGDIIASKARKSICYQAKRYKNKVSKKAIQEVYAAKKVYHTDQAAVITNSYFTKPAIEFAHKLGVELIDRDGLSKMIAQAQKKKAHHKKLLPM